MFFIPFNCMATEVWLLKKTLTKKNMGTLRIKWVKKILNIIIDCWLTLIS